MSNHFDITLQEQHQREIDLGIAWARGTIQGVVREGICVEPNSDGHRLLFDWALYPSRDPTQYREEHHRRMYINSADSGHYYCPCVQMRVLQSEPPFPDVIFPQAIKGLPLKAGILLSRGFVDRWAKHWIGTEQEARDPPLQYSHSPGIFSQTWRNLPIVPCLQQIRLAGPSVGPAERQIFHRRPWMVANWFWLCDENEPFCLLDAEWVNSSGQAHICFHSQGCCFFPRK